MKDIILFFQRNPIKMLIYCIILVTCYMPVILNDYAFSDDWVKIYYGINGFKPYIVPEITAGRIIYALMIYISWKFVFLHDSLRIFRILDILAIIAFAISFYYFLNKGKYFNSNGFLQFLLPLTIALSPPLYVYAAWYTCWPSALLYSQASYLFL